VLNIAGTTSSAFIPPDQRGIDLAAMGDLGPGVGARVKLQRPFIGGEDAVDGDIAIGVAVELDMGAVHPFAPGVEIVLRFGEIAVIAGGHADIGLAHRHGAFGQRAVRHMLPGGAQPEPIRRRRPLSMPFLIIASSKTVIDLIADAMLEVAAQPLFLDGLQGAVLIVMHTGQAVLGELRRNEGHAFQQALLFLRRGELFHLAGLEQGDNREIGDPAVQAAARVPVERAAIGVGVSLVTPAIWKALLLTKKVWPPRWTTATGWSADTLSRS